MNFLSIFCEYLKFACISFIRNDREDWIMKAQKSNCYEEYDIKVIVKPESKYY